MTIRTPALVPALVIVADDLTGAADSAARCVQAGLSAEVWLEPTHEPAQVDVVAVSSDSRFLLPAEAAQRVRETLAILATGPTAAGVTWYKKIDSTLRGNLGAELEAMLALLPGKSAVISPAFPAQGRGLEGGKLVYAGAPPRHLPTLLSAQSQFVVGVIGLATVRQGVHALRKTLQERRRQGERLLVVDGMTDADLVTIVAAANTDAYLLCGSAGMVGPLAARWTTQQTSPEVQTTRIPPGPILAVVGSGSKTAHVQVAQVKRTGIMHVRVLGHSWYEMDLVGAQCHPVGDWLLHLAPPTDNTQLEGPTARAQAARLADLTYAAVDRLQPSALILVGGDTAYYVLRRLGIERLRVVEELLPGIPLTFGVDRHGIERAVVLKPGNFGDKATLVTLHAALRERQQALPDV